ncbi:MAG: hypothetical protein QOJ81_932, partial [Chloroflexota bacterium]|nr:hypothetical protein [Chloroflexota bacterium]
YGLDFVPFLFLLAVIMVTRGTRLTRYQVVLIGASVLINLWGVLWILKFAQAPGGLNGWTWVSY